MALIGDGRAASQAALESQALRAAQGASVLLQFVTGQFLVEGGGGRNIQRDMQMLGSSVARAGRATYDEWDGRHGGRVGQLSVFAPDTVRNGPNGVRIEAAGTNSVVNPRCEGALAGAPGTLPTGWGAIPAGCSVVGSGYESGWPYVDLRFQLAANGSASVPIVSDGSTSNAFMILSACMKIAGGSATNVNLIGLRLSHTGATSPVHTSGNTGAAAAATTPAILGILDQTLRRFQINSQSPASATNRAASVVVSATAGGAVDITLRIACPQLEASAAVGDTATSPILPPIGAPAISNRAADSSFVSLSNVSRASYACDIGGWDFRNGTPHGDVREYRPNVPRVRPGSGLLTERAATNQIWNPRAERAAVGAPGTDPVNWLRTANGLTISVTATGTDEDGDFVEYEFSGTSNAINPSIRFNAISAVIAANPATFYTHSVSLRLVRGVVPAGCTLSLLALYLDGSNAAVAGGTLRQTIQRNDGSTLVDGIDETLRRYFWTQEAPALSARQSMGLELTMASGFVIPAAFAIRIYYPQVESGNEVTSPVLPQRGVVGGATTRAIDLVSLNTGSYASMNSGALYAEATMLTPSASAGLVAFGTSTNYAAIDANSGTLALTARTLRAGVNISTPVAEGAAVPVNGTPRLVAAASWGADGAITVKSFSKAAVAGATGQLPIFTGGFLDVGQRPALNRRGMWTQQARYWPRSLSTTELNNLTATGSITG